MFFNNTTSSSEQEAAMLFFAYFSSVYSIEVIDFGTENLVIFIFDLSNNITFTVLMFFIVYWL